jgi:hypothetical protein
LIPSTSPNSRPVTSSSVPTALTWRRQALHHPRRRGHPGAGGHTRLAPPRRGATRTRATHSVSRWRPGGSVTRAQKLHPSGLIEPRTRLSPSCPRRPVGGGILLNVSASASCPATTSEDGVADLETGPPWPASPRSRRGADEAWRRPAGRLAPALTDDAAPAARLPHAPRSSDARHHDDAYRGRAHRALLDGWRLGTLRTGDRAWTGQGHRRGVQRPY